MKLNQLDGKSRKFLCIQLPENLDLNLQTADSKAKEIISNSIDFLDSIGRPHFITEIGKERIRRVGQKIQSSLHKLDSGKMDQFRLDGGSAQDDAKSSLDTGFKVFKLDSSNLKIWDSSRFPEDDLISISKRLNNMIDRVKSDRSDLDVVYEIMLKLGVPLTYSVTPVEITGGNPANKKAAYAIGDDCLLIICLAENLTTEIIEEMADYTPGQIILAENSLADDTAMSNAFYILRDRNIELKLV